jgi:hypothetical protein
MSGWANFLVSQVGASAALAGLVFVGVSINLARILSIGGLPESALEALVLLLAVLVISSLLLVPQPLTAAGIELLLAGLADTAILLFLVAYSRRKMDSRYYGYLWFRGTLSLCASLPFTIAGIAVLVWNTGGLYWIVPATLLSITVAIYNAWVLLVEINR